MTSDEKLQYVLDRIGIEDCLHRYCHAVDRGDAELLKTVYWEDGSDDHVFWKGPAPDFVDFCIPIVNSRDQTWHAISNIVIRIEGADAYVQSYFDAYERVRRKDGTSNDVTFIGRYVDHFQKRGDEWRIKERQVVMDSWRIWPDTADWSRGVFGTKADVGKRGDEHPKDPSHKLFAGRLMNEPISNRPLVKWGLSRS